MEHRKILGHLRSINHNTITHFAIQSDLPTSENFNKIPVRCIFPSHFLFLFFTQDPCTLHLSWPFSFSFFYSRSLYVASFLAIFIFLLHSRSVSLYTGFFLAICIFTLLRCCSDSLNSGRDLAHFSILHCIVASFPCTLQTFHYTYHWLTPVHCDNLYIFSWPCQLNKSVTVNIYQQLPVPRKTRSENQRLQNFYSLIHPCTVSHQDYYSLYVHLHSVCSIFQRMFLFTAFSFVALTSLLRTLSLCRCVALLFLTFGMACQ